MLEAIIAGESRPAMLADLAEGRLRNKRELPQQALTGVMRAHHRFLIAEHLIQLDNLEEQIGRFDAQIAAYLDQLSAPGGPTPAAAPAEPTPASLTWNGGIALADVIPGIGPRLAQDILAETGVDMRRFPTAGHFTSWAKLCPGNRQSGGKRLSAAIGHGNRHLRARLVQAAWAAVKVKGSYFAACFHRLAGRRGAKRAIIAVAHRILIALYHMLKEGKPFHDLGATCYAERYQTQLRGLDIT